MMNKILAAILLASLAAAFIVVSLMAISLYDSLKQLGFSDKEMTIWGGGKS